MEKGTSDPLTRFPAYSLAGTVAGQAVSAVVEGDAGGSAGEVEERTASLRKITLARALYRCGDYQGLGRKILEQYKTDFRGLFARHAYAVLAGK